MKEFTYTVTDPVGIHARPAGRLAKKVEELGSSVTIIKDGKCVEYGTFDELMNLKGEFYKLEKTQFQNA